MNVGPKSLEDNRLEEICGEELSLGEVDSICTLSEAAVLFIILAVIVPVILVRSHKYDIRDAHIWAWQSCWKDIMSIVQHNRYKLYM